MAKFNWTPIEEMDLDDGTHTGYTAILDYNSNIVLSQMSDGTWDVEIYSFRSKHFYTQVNCKTLRSAKAWAARYL